MAMINFMNALIAQTDWAILLLRIVIGVIFIAHGWKKAKGFSGTAKWLASGGFKPGWFWGGFLTIVELGGGIFILAGLFTQVAALVLIVSMIVALLFRLKKKNPFVGGWEFDLILIAALLALTTLGAGPFAIGG